MLRFGSNESMAVAMLRFGSNESKVVATLALVCCGVALAMSGCASDDDPVVKTKSAGSADLAGAGGAVSALQLTATPADALDDAEVTIVVSGLLPGTAVTVRAETTDSVGQRFAAAAQFVASATGRVDLTTDAPISGSYQGISAMGLFWSMLPVGSATPNAVLFNEVPLSTRQVTLTAIVGVETAPAMGVAGSTGASASGGTAGADASGTFASAGASSTLATTTIVRRSVLDETKVVRTAVTDRGLVGVLFAPTGTGPHPTLLVLGGSEGGMPESRAALLASHGYAAFALAYFGLAGLPAQLASIPLEYFEAALAWLEQQPAVDMTRLGVMGASKGGELALLLASRYPERLRAVVAYVPSSVVWQGIPKGAAAVGSSWSYQGTDLPYVPMAFTSEEIGHFMRSEPQALTPSYLRSLANDNAVAAATIAVEEIAGPILLVSAGDDSIWPSRAMSESIMTRLASSNHPYADVHLTYDNAGHLIAHPYLPTSLLQFGMNLFGGTSAATATACIESWREVSEFLSANLE